MKKESKIILSAIVMLLVAIASYLNRRCIKNSITR